jgi:CheY-like chemotaxis protein
MGADQFEFAAHPFPEGAEELIRSAQVGFDPTAAVLPSDIFPRAQRPGCTAKVHMYRPILYAEDDENDVFFMQRALRDAGVGNKLLVMRDGREAIDYLEGHAQFAEREKHPLPVLVVLDLKMPVISGLEVLRELRTHRELEDLPVIVLVCSSEDRNIQEAMDLGASACIVKPPTGESLRKVIRNLGEDGFDVMSAKPRTDAALTQSSQR